MSLCAFPRCLFTISRLWEAAFPFPLARTADNEQKLNEHTEFLFFFVVLVRNTSVLTVGQTVPEAASLLPRQEHMLPVHRERGGRN
jgi:hypothetical protein